MGYSYSPHSADEKARQFFSKKWKHLAIAAVVIVFFVIFYLTNIALTSYATYQQGFEQQISDVKASVSNVQSEKGSCLASLEATNNILKICESDLSSKTALLNIYRTVERELNETGLNLANVRAEKNTCLTSLEATVNNLKQCESDISSKTALLNTCGMEKTSLNNSLTNTVSSLNTCKTEKDSVVQSFRQLVKNSVRAICCSYGDVQAGSVRSWDIVSNSITCTGSYTVNCSNGETNY